MVVGLASLLLVGLIGCMSETRNPIEGAWQIVQGTQTRADTSFSYSQADLFGMKMIVDNQWAIFGRYVGDGDTVTYYSGGSYTLEGKIYTESIVYSKTSLSVGRVVPFEVEVRNDTLIQRGPVKTGEYAGDDWDLYEVWVRVK